jgi:signal transduction histidine kinase
MNYDLVSIRSDDSGFSTLARLAKTTKDISGKEIELSFYKCKHFDANMAAPLAAILNKLTTQRNTIKIKRAPWEVEKILRKNRFLLDFGYSQLEDVNHTTLPFKHIGLSNTQSFATYLAEHMNGKGIPQMTPALEKAFRQSIFEVFENCVGHSQSELGVFVCGQFYPYDGRLDLTISDAGIGIRQNVRRHLQDGKMSSTDAIKWALKEGHTTKTGSKPGGMGLKLLKDFIRVNGGKIQIASRQGFYQFSGDKEEFIQLASDLPGTTVNLEINTKDQHTYQLTSETTPTNIF